MKKCKTLAMLTVALGVVFMSNSCSSDSAATTSDAAALTVTANDESQASSFSDDVDNEVDNYVTSSSVNGYSAVKSTAGAEVAANGPVITVDKPDSTNFPKIFTIDYGTTGITGKRGNVFKGIIKIVVSNKMTVPNSSRTITFDNFSVNGNKVSGTKVVTYKGLMDVVHPYWTISVRDTINRVDGTTVIWNSERTRERTNNNDTPLIYWDDNYSISGSSSGVNAKGVAFTAVIDANYPLLIGGGWPFFTKGTITLTSDSKTVVIDFGNGNKDRIATATINGVTKTFTMKN